MTRPLLLVCHEATRTGGARVITELFERAKPLIEVPLAVQLLADGPLEGRLRALADVARLGADPLAVVVNSALAADALCDLDSSIPALLYVHEEGATLRGLPDRARAGVLRPGLRILCVSDAARRQLEAMGAHPDRIRVLRPLVGTSTRAGDDAALRARLDLGIGPGERLVLGCGEASWRKGADLFVDVARRLAHRPDVTFAWVGRRPRGFGRTLDRDATLARVDGRVVWTGELPDTGPLLAAADLLLMTSREDPQPLVPLEAALNDTATLAFAVSGLGELGADGAAAVVPYPDTTAMACTVEQLVDDPARAGVLAEAARRRASLQAADAVVPEFLGELRALLRRSHPEGVG